MVFDRWFAGGANNAGIVAAGLYSDRVPQFAALLAAEGGDLPRFYARVKALAALPKAERDESLAALAPIPRCRAVGSLPRPAIRADDRHGASTPDARGTAQSPSGMPFARTSREYL